MKKFKKIISLALALLMLLSVVSISASAHSKYEINAFTYSWVSGKGGWEVDGVRNEYKGSLGSKVCKIPDYHEGSPVIGIAKFAFEDVYVRNLILSNNTQYIDNGAFYHSGITNIYLPKTLTYISASAFFGTNSSFINVRYQGTKEQWDALTGNFTSSNHLFSGGKQYGYPDDCYHISTKSHAKVEPTCMVPGREQGVTCNDCGREIGGFAEIPTIPHYASELYTIKKPTCTESGEYEFRCTRDENCTYSERRGTTTPLGHNFARRDPVCRRGCGFVCKCRCHKEDFLWKIIQFFYKLFKIKEHCECGYYRTHWEA